MYRIMIIEDNEKLETSFVIFLVKTAMKLWGRMILSIPWISFIRSSRICFYWI